MPELIRVTDSAICCDQAWEDAYKNYETPEQAASKFRRRARLFGAHRWERGLSVVEIFCGSGAMLEQLTELGFAHLEGVDLSASLLELYAGPARCYVADCRELPFEDASRDIVWVDGGLHHLPSLDDLERVLREEG